MKDEFLHHPGIQHEPSGLRARHPLAARRPLGSLGVNAMWPRRSPRSGFVNISLRLKQIARAAAAVLNQPRRGVTHLANTPEAIRAQGFCASWNALSAPVRPPSPSAEDAVSANPLRAYFEANLRGPGGVEVGPLFQRLSPAPREVPGPRGHGRRGRGLQRRQPADS